MNKLVAISLGSGVQSSVLLLMAASGLLQPKPVRAIFADTMWEPESVYSYLDYLTPIAEAAGIGVDIVSRGDTLAKNNVRSGDSMIYDHTHIETQSHDNDELILALLQAAYKPKKYIPKPVIVEKATMKLEEGSATRPLPEIHREAVDDSEWRTLVNGHKRVTTMQVLFAFFIFMPCWLLLSGMIWGNLW